jgi:hypothetical protein
MDDEKLKKIEIIYEQLLSLVHGIDIAKTNRFFNGPVVQYKNALDRLEELTGEDLDHFLPSIKPFQDQIVCDRDDLVAQLNGLLGWLRATYLPDKSPHYMLGAPSPEGPTTSVNISNDVNVTQVISVDIVELLTRKETEFKEGSKERSFIEKLKAGVRTAKNTAAIIALIVQTATDCGLTITDLHKIFG